MKFRKHMSKLLALSILTNNIYFNSSANTEIPNRYQTLDGEYITIDDSTEGELIEIEVFGNTVQDENNLEDIQSVGDLYVDENGSPILDSQGREQYKIDIVSSNNGNLLNGVWEKLNFGGAGEVYYNSNYRMTDFIEVRGEQQYTLSFKEDTLNSVGFGFYDNEGKIINTIVSQKTVKTPTNTRYIRVRVGTTDSSLYPLDNLDDYNIKLEVGSDATSYKIPNTYTESRVTILLPCPLQRVTYYSDVISDRLYWDISNNRYIIEKKIGTTDIDFSSKNYTEERMQVETKTTMFQYSLNIPHEEFLDGAPVSYPYIISNKFKTQRTYDLIWQDNIEHVDKIGFTCSISYKTIIVGRLDNRVQVTSDVLVQSLKELGNIKIVYTLNSPQIIETNITSKMTIPTYDGLTHIFTETKNGINPTLKVTVDRLPQVAQNAVIEAETNSSLTNISLARMYINMLPESLYKDQLQEQLSQVFSSEMTLDRKNATANLDVYIKSENMLSMSLDTNSVDFDNYSGVSSMEIKDAVGITISSSLPYSLNAYMPTEIASSDGLKTMPIDVLNIKEGSKDSYQTFANTSDKVILKGDCTKGNAINHSIDLKLDSNNAHQADIYKTVIKFEAEQK